MQTKFFPAKSISEDSLTQLHLTAENDEEIIFLKSAFKHDIVFVDSLFVENNKLIVRYRQKET